MVLNAHFAYDYADLKFARIPSAVEWAPGAIDRYYSLPAMFRITAFLGVMCLVSDLSQDSKWRFRIWRTMAFAGVSLTLLGLAQKALGAEMIFWGPGDYRTPAVWENGILRYYLFFASYYYSANAAAFLNLVFPLVCAFAAMASRKTEAPWARAFWFSSVLLCAAGAIATASKAGVMITALLTLLFLINIRSRLIATWVPLSRTTRMIAALSMVMLLIAGLSVGGSALVLRLGEEGGVYRTIAERLVVAKGCMRMIPDSGAWGFGVGNFRVAFPHYTAEFGSTLDGVWEQAHQDYLQTLVEWGWVGAALWAILVLGGIPAAWKITRARRVNFAPGTRTLLSASIIALAGVLIHALVDFPLQVASLQFYTAVHLGMVWGSRYWEY